MPDNVLYIIGNGFDMHHGIHSSYKYFSVWLSQHNHRLYRKLLDVCQSKALWWNFEEALAYVDRDYLLAMSETWLPTNWDSDKDSYGELFYTGDNVSAEGYDLWKEIEKYFLKWVTTIKWERGSDKQMIRLDTEARFINLYHILRIQILYTRKTDPLYPWKTIKHEEPSCDWTWRHRYF